MTKLTINIDDELLKKARRRALQQGTSIDALVRDYLAGFACADQRRRDAVRNLLNLATISNAARGRRRVTRDGIHER